ncbi:MAG TPA: hypothetical protein VMF59_16850 [Bacteroidota bacterium]|nr:hypothetical protein [Bacteroidota bacterium]
MAYNEKLTARVREALAGARRVEERRDSSGEDGGARAGIQQESKSIEEKNITGRKVTQW